MQAVLFDGSLHIVAEYPEPAVAPGDACIRVTLAGICATDQAIIQGYKGASRSWSTVRESRAAWLQL